MWTYVSPIGMIDALLTCYQTRPNGTHRVWAARKLRDVRAESDFQYACSDVLAQDEIQELEDRNNNAGRYPDDDD